MVRFVPKAIRVYYGGMWEFFLKNGVKNARYKGGSFNDSELISVNDMNHKQLVSCIMDVRSMKSIRNPEIQWLLKGVPLHLDSDKSISIWWKNIVPSAEGVVAVYFSREQVSGDEEDTECGSRPINVDVDAHGIDAGISMPTNEDMAVGHGIYSGGENESNLRSPTMILTNKNGRQKLPFRRNFHHQDLPEEELDALPRCHVDEVEDDEAISLSNIENTLILTNSTVPVIDPIGFVDTQKQLGREGTCLRRRVDINNIDPDEGYYSDDSDNGSDPEEENGGEYIEEEEEEQYVLDDNLRDVVIRENTCEPYEGIVNADSRNDEWKLEVGMEWNTKEEARHYIRTYAIRNKFSTQKIHNDDVRIRLKCSEKECDWFVRVRKLSDRYTFKLKKAHLMHTCVPDLSGRTKMANARWIAKEIDNEAWHARAIALESLHGSYEESYKKLPQLCSYLLKANPGSIMTTSRDENSKKWTGTCISFKASLDGFVRGCRPLIGIDGCFLKGKYGGVCLAMTSLDGNNGMFPLAVYLCQAENKDNWMRFFEIMKDALNRHPQQLIIMSDRQKGLDSAVETDFPQAIQRYCFRHIFGNMREYHRGGMIEELTWNAARAYTEADFKKWMERLDEKTKKKKGDKDKDNEGETSTRRKKKKACDKTPVEYLNSEDPKYWARAFMPIEPKVEHITNNFSESFNSWILELRDKPVHRLLIDFTLMMMTLIYKKKQDIAKMGADDDIVPRVQKIIDSHCEWMRHYTVAGSSTHNFCVQSSEGTWWNVDLEKHTCDCKKWDISGIPCVHAVASIAQYSSTRKIQWSRYCSPFLTVKYYKAAYSEWIKPPLHETSWALQPSDVLPPLLHRRAGRPRVNRRRGEAEGPAPSSDNQRQCGICKQYGHNRLTCQMGPTKAQAKRTRNEEQDGQVRPKKSKPAKGKKTTETPSTYTSTPTVGSQRSAPLTAPTTYTSCSTSLVIASTAPPTRPPQVTPTTRMT